MRRKHLEKELNIFFSNLHAGKSSARKKRFDTLHTIINDLQIVGRLPLSFRHVKNEDIQLLITHWQDKKLKNSTILNRISVLRHFLDQAFNIQILSNEEFNLTKEPVTKKPSVDENIIDWVHHPITKSILGFQIYFGLTKFEAIKIEIDSAVAEDDLIISKIIASNNKTRFVPILTQYQQDAIKLRKGILGERKTLLEQMPIDIINGLYVGELYSFNIKRPDYLRMIYARNRMAVLKKRGKKDIEAKKILRDEMGFANNNTMERALL